MQEEAHLKEVCPTSTQKLIERGYALLDVRERTETEQLKFVAPKIYYIPFSELAQRYEELPKEENFVVAANTGFDSIEASIFLLAKGLKVLNMKKGLAKWVQKGYATEGNINAVDWQNAVACSHHHHH